MLATLFLALYYLFLILEGILFLYIISAWFPGGWLRTALYELLRPIFTLIGLLLKHSIFKSNIGDFSPMLALLLLSYLQSLFYQLSSH